MRRVLRVLVGFGCVAAWAGAIGFAVASGLQPDFAASAAFMWLGALPLVILGAVLMFALADA